MDIRILSRQGVPDVLDILSKGGEKPVTTKELLEKTPVNRQILRVIRKEGLVEVSEERVLLRTVPVKIRHASYRLTEKGRKMLELCTTLSEEDTELLRITPAQIKAITSLKGGEWKRMRDLPEEARNAVQNIVKRGLVEKRVSEEEENREVYGVKRLYTITEKGLKVDKAYKTIKFL